MSRLDNASPASHEAGRSRRRWRVPFALRLAMAAIFAAAVAFSASYSLWRLNL